MKLCFNWVLVDTINDSPINYIHFIGLNSTEVAFANHFHFLDQEYLEHTATKFVAFLIQPTTVEYASSKLIDFRCDNKGNDGIHNDSVMVKDDDCDF